MSFKLELDVWDLGALVALGCVFAGLFAWHWPAGLVSVGAAYLWLYYHRETRLVPQPPAEPAPVQRDGAEGEQPD